MRKCEGVSRPFASDTSPKRIDREGLGKRRTGTRQVPLQISLPLTVTAILRHLESFWPFIECVSNKKKNHRKLGSNLDLSNPNLSRALPLNFHTHPPKFRKFKYINQQTVFLHDISTADDPKPFS